MSLAITLIAKESRTARGVAVEKVKLVFFFKFRLQLDMKNDFINISSPIAGCTTAQTRCHQLTVNYTKTPYKDWVKAPVDLELVDWDVADTKFLINTEGCGYPNLGVNCTIFAKEYGYVS